MKNKLKEYLPYIAVVLAITFPWFLKTGYLFLTDMVWGPHFAFAWSDGWIVFNSVVKIFSFILPMDLIEKLLIAGSFFIVLLGGKKIVECFISDKWLVFVIGLFALFNPFVYDRAMYGQFGTIGSIGLMFLGIGFLLEYIEKRQMRQIVFAGVSIALAVQFSQHFIFFIAVFYSVIFVPLLFIDKQKAGKTIKKIVGDVVKISLILVVIAFVLNANWVVGAVMGKSAVGEFVSKGITMQDFTALQTAGDSGVDAFKNVLMMSGFWGKDQFRYHDLTTMKENWGRSFFFLLPLLLWGIVIGLRSGEKKKKYMTVGLIIVFICSALLAVGIRMPVGREITNFFFEYVPFYKGLRESQKWVGLIVVAYLIFISLGIREFFIKRIVQNNSFIVKVFIGAVIIMQAPLFLFGFAGQVKSTPYPADWYEVNDYINQTNNLQQTTHNKECADTILFLPWHMYMSFSWIGKIVVDPAHAFFSCPVIKGSNMEWGGIYDNSGDKKGELVRLWLDARGKTDLLLNKDINIRYIILAKEIDWNNYQWLNGNVEVMLVKETETLKVYKVKTD